MTIKTIFSLLIVSVLFSACTQTTHNDYSAHEILDSDSPPLIGCDLSSNQGNGIPFERLQLITYYDGLDQATLQIEVERGGGWRSSWIEVRTRSFGIEIGTFEFDLRGYRPTGRFRIGGVIENGVVDGLAFAWLWRDQDGHYRSYRSEARSPTSDARIIGIWPLLQNLYGDNLVNVTPHVTTNFGRGQARALILGAELLPNGKYSK